MTTAQARAYETYQEQLHGRERDGCFLPYVIVQIPTALLAGGFRSKAGMIQAADMISLHS